MLKQNIEVSQGGNCKSDGNEGFGERKTLTEVWLVRWKIVKPFLKHIQDFA